MLFHEQNVTLDREVNRLVNKDDSLRSDLVRKSAIAYNI